MMSRLSSLAATSFGIVGLGRLEDIRRRELGGVGRVLGKCGHLLGKLGHLLSELGILLEKLGISLFAGRDPSLVEWFSVRFHP